MRWLVLCLCAVMLVGCGGVTVERKLSEQPAAEPAGEPVVPSMAEPRTILVKTGRDGMLAFQPPVLFAKQGELLEITLANEDRAQAHSYVIPELNVKTRQAMPGQSDTVRFAAEKAGEFKFYCDVPGHKDAGEVGRITVEP